MVHCMWRSPSAGTNSIVGRRIWLRAGSSSKGATIGNAAGAASIFATPTGIFWNLQRRDCGRCIKGYKPFTGLRARQSWRSVACPIFHHLDCYIRTNRAFKSTFIVVRLVRLDAGEPHLCLADSTKRASDDPLLRKILILAHTTPRFFGYGRLTEARFKRGGKTPGVTQALATFTREGDHSPPIG